MTLNMSFRSCHCSPTDLKLGAARGQPPWPLAVRKIVNWVHLVFLQGVQMLSLLGISPDIVGDGCERTVSAARALLFWADRLSTYLTNEQSNSTRSESASNDVCGLVSSEFMRIFREFRFHNLRLHLHLSRSHPTRRFTMSANTTKQPAGGHKAKDKPAEKKELKILMLHGTRLPTICVRQQKMY